MSLKLILLIIAAYLLGSIPTAYIIGRLKAGIDITQHGSGNVGGTNALRVLGLGPALLVAVIDISKALLPTFLATKMFEGDTWPALVVALAAVLGHNYSAYLRWRGGKGIATTIGACLVLFPSQIFVLVPIALAVVFVTRYVSLGSLALVTFLPILLVYQRVTPAEICFAFVVALLGIWRHRANITRLLSGTENRLGHKQRGN